jgi:HAD superfamily hydrolase (TIGR01509 family)
MSYKGIIFDFNGTLVWDTPLHKEAWLRYSAELGHPITEKEYYSSIHGQSTNNILELVAGKNLSTTELSVMSEEKEHQYRLACLANPDVFKFAPGVEDFLDYLKAARIPMSIATASEKPNVDFFVEQFELTKWFDPDLFVYDDGTVANKPEPDIYIKAAATLGFRPCELVIIEDSYFGVLSAKGAGAGCLIVTGPAEDQHDELNKLEGINSFISDFAEIDKNLFSL